MQMSNFLFPLEREASQALGLHGGLCKEEGQPGEMGCSLIMGQTDSCTMKHRVLHKPGWVPVVVGWGGPALPRLTGASASHLGCLWLLAGAACLRLRQWEGFRRMLGGLVGLIWEVREEASFSCISLP